MRVWGLGMWGHQVWDAGTCGMQGHVGWGRGDVKYRDAGGKVRGKCDISFLVKMCYLWST